MFRRASRRPISPSLSRDAARPASPQPPTTRLPLGNQALQRLLLSYAAQAKLTVNQPGDRYEQEADRVANTVMRMPEHATPVPAISPLMAAGLQGKFPECAAQEEEAVQREMAGARSVTASSHLESQFQSLEGRGNSLPPELRGFFEPRFGRDLSSVRIHTDGPASESARQLRARAYTRGNHVVFAAGEYAPHSHEGRQLLAHELTHTIQQASRGNTQIQRWVLPTDWLDYIGLAIDIGERVYIELAYDEGEEKDFQRFVNTLFFAIDLIFAALPGAGGGGLAVRMSHGVAVAAWRVVPASAKEQIAVRVANKMGWNLAKATYMINMYFRSSEGSGKGKESTPSESTGTPGPSGKASTEKYLENRWDKGTFGSIKKSIEYHVLKHGKGLSVVEYTQRAEQAFKDLKTVKSSTTDMQGRAAVKVVSEQFGTGLFTPHGRIIWFHPKL